MVMERRNSQKSMCACAHVSIPTRLLRGLSATVNDSSRMVDGTTYCISYADLFSTVRLRILQPHKVTPPVARGSRASTFFASLIKSKQGKGGKKRKGRGLPIHHHHLLVLSQGKRTAAGSTLYEECAVLN